MVQTTRHRSSRADLGGLAAPAPVAPAPGPPGPVAPVQVWSPAVDPGVVEWSAEAVRATFLRRGELVPPLFWAASPSGDPHHIAAAAELAARSRAQGTNRAYGRHVERWLKWAQEHQVCALPAAPGDVQDFLLQEVLVRGEDGEPVRDGDGQLCGRVVMGTVTQMQAALTRLHRLASAPSPFDAPLLKALVAGMRRTLTVAPLRAKAALTWDLLEEVLAVPVRGAAPSALRADAVRALSRCTGASAGQLARLLDSDLTDTDRGLAVVLPPGRRGGPVVRHDLTADGPGSEAVVAVRRWRAASQEWPGTAVFRDSTGKALTRQGLHRIVTSQGPVTVDGELVQGPPVRFAEVRDRAVLLAGWVSALRRSNLAALNWSDMTRDEAGWTVYITRSKTDQEGRGNTVSIPTAPVGSGMADAARALDDWLDLMTAVLGADPRRMRNVPVFPRIDRHDHLVRSADGMPVRLSGWGINDIVQRAARAAGLEERVHLTHGGRATVPDAAPFGAHSLRSGYVTEALSRGVPVHQVMAQTHHQQASSVQIYFKPAKRPSLLAANAVLQGIGAARGNAAAAAASEPQPQRVPLARRTVGRWDLSGGVPVR